MANKTVSFRLPSELIEAIEAEAIITGQSKTNVVIAALSKFYGCPHALPQSVMPEQLQQQLNELKRQITILSEANNLHQLITSPDTAIKLNPEVNTAISSIPLTERLAWIHGVLTTAAQKELGLQPMESGISEECSLKVVSHSKG